MVEEMTPAEIRHYVALRAAARDGSSASEIARHGLAFAESTIATDRTGKFKNSLTPLRTVALKILDDAKAEIPELSRPTPG
jgi:hypothetical protein